MPYPCKALWEDMQLVTPYEFLGRKCHRCFPAAVSVLFQAKRYRPFFFIDVQDTLERHSFMTHWTPAAVRGPSAPSSVI